MSSWILRVIFALTSGEWEIIFGTQQNNVMSCKFLIGHIMFNRDWSIFQMFHWSKYIQVRIVYWCILQTSYWFKIFSTNIPETHLATVGNSVQSRILNQSTEKYYNIGWNELHLVGRVRVSSKLSRANDRTGPYWLISEQGWSKETQFKRQNASNKYLM